MEVRWDDTRRESNLPHVSQHTSDQQIQDERDPRLALEMAIEWAHLGGD
jgi:hypothetical protein